MSYIYFVQAVPAGPIKIGTTNRDPRLRMVKIRSDSPWPIRLLGVIHGSAAQERQIHEVLGFWRTHGEWFEPHTIVLAAIAQALECGKSLPISEPQKKVYSANKQHRHLLTRYRSTHSVSLKQLATQIGCRQSFLSQIETGQRKPSAALAARIQSVTGIPAQSLRPDLAVIFAPGGRA